MTFRFEERVLAYCEGMLTDAEKTVLFQELANDPDKMKVFQEFEHLETVLTEYVDYLSVPMNIERQLAARIPVLGEMNPALLESTSVSLLSSLRISLMSSVTRQIIMVCSVIGLGSLTWFALDHAAVPPMMQQAIHSQTNESVVATEPMQSFAEANRLLSTSTGGTSTHQLPPIVNELELPVTHAGTVARTDIHLSEVQKRDLEPLGAVPDPDEWTMTQSIPMSKLQYFLVTPSWLTGFSFQVLTGFTQTIGSEIVRNQNAPGSSYLIVLQYRQNDHFSFGVEYGRSAFLQTVSTYRTIHAGNAIYGRKNSLVESLITHGELRGTYRLNSIGSFIPHLTVTAGATLEKYIQPLFSIGGGVDYPLGSILSANLDVRYSGAWTRSVVNPIPEPGTAPIGIIHESREKNLTFSSGLEVRLGIGITPW